TAERPRGKRRWFFGGLGVLLLCTAALGASWPVAAHRPAVARPAGRVVSVRPPTPPTPVATAVDAAHRA
ncbi:MAG TPA: hypothetical protein VFO77_12850, partial [Actinoplanes sp.]|nr:hypothetical protein [Actinoplanes sp.]